VKPPLSAVALLALAAAPSLARADVGDIAELFPPATLAFVELHKPGDAAPQLAAVFKGTPLEDSIAWIHDRKDKAKTIPDLNGKPELAVAGLLASPEMLAELKRVRAAAALTGFSSDHAPQTAFVALTGDSPAAGLAARAFLTTSPNLRRVGTVGNGVPIFQTRPTFVTYGPNGQPNPVNEKPPEAGANETTYAYTPGLFVAGSGKAAVADVVTRFQAGRTMPSFAGSAAFKLAAPQRRAGLFAVADPAALVAKLDAANRATENTIDPDAYAFFKLVGNAKAFRAVSAHVGLKDSGLAVTVSGALRSGEKSPLVELVSGGGATVELLHPAPGSSAVAFAVSLPRPNRGAAALRFADAVAKAFGQIGRLPSEAVRDVESRLKLSIVQGLFDRTASVLVAVPAAQELPKGATPLPLLVLKADDAATAAKYEECLKAVVADLVGTAEPSSEAIGGQKVFTLPGANLPWKAPVHFGRNGVLFAVGLDRKLVGGALAGDAGGSAVGGQAGPLPGGDGAGAAGAVSIGRLVQMWNDAPPVPGPVPTRGPVPAPPQPPGNNPNVPKPADPVKAAKEFAAALTALPAMTVAARRTADEFRLEAFQPGLVGGRMPNVIGTAASWFDAALSPNPSGSSGGIRRRIR
jgi:hypothetical protein